MNWSFFKKFITFMLCWMQCTHQFSHMRKYQCIKRCCENFINMTKLLVSSYNRFDVVIVYFIIYVIVCIFNELIANQFFYQLRWFRFQIFRMNLHSTLNTNISIHIENLIETTRYIDQKLKTLKNFLVSINQSVLKFLNFKYFQMIYYIIYSQISWFMFRNQISNWNSKTFSFFLFCIRINH